MGGRGRVGGQGDVIEELKFLGKFTQKKIGGGVGLVGWGQGGCEQRIKVFVKIQKKKIFFFFWGGGGVGSGGGGRVRGGRVGEGGGSGWM